MTDQHPDVPSQDLAAVAEPATDRGPSAVVAAVSLTCGVLSIPLAILVIGGLFGFLGAVFGVTQLCTARRGRVMAWLGAGLSVVGCGLSLVTLIILVSAGRNALSNLNMTESFDGWVGAEAPDFIAMDTAGDYLQLARLRGKGVILDFRGTHCAACEKESAFFDELRRSYPDTGLSIVTIGSGPLDALKKAAEEGHLSGPIVSSQGLPRPYCDIPVVPAAVAIGPDGRIRRIALGYTTLDDLKNLAEEVAASGVTHAAP